MKDLRSQTCCFTGNREIEPQNLGAIKRNLRSKIIELIEKENYRYFGVGGSWGADSLIASELFLLKESRYPDIKVILVAPFSDGFTKYWSPENRALYEELLPKYDKVVYISDKPSKSAYLARNRHLVDNSSYCIACWDPEKRSGGTFYTISYALQNAVPVFNAFPHGIFRRGRELTSI